MNQPSEKTAPREPILESGADLRQADRDRVLFTWHGCAHYHIHYKGKKIIIDPLYHRPAGAHPHLPLTRENVDQLDYLLLTHAHLDHSWDFPYLASKHRPQAYGPKEYLAYVQRKADRWGLEFDQARLHRLEDSKGKKFFIEDLEVTPYQIGTEEIDFWAFYRTMLPRPFRHWSFAAMTEAHKFLLYHLRDNCFGYHFRFPASDKTMLYIGNLTDQVNELAAVERVNVLAIPFCPANEKWVDHIWFLIGRFIPDVVLVHHYDNFWHPFTHPRYLNLNAFKNAVLEKYPQANLSFARFMETIDFEQLASTDKRGNLVAANP